jgi:hypothetical protein
VELFSYHDVLGLMQVVVTWETEIMMILNFLLMNVNND